MRESKVADPMKAILRKGPGRGVQYRDASEAKTVVLEKTKSRTVLEVEGMKVIIYNNQPH